MSEPHDSPPGEDLTVWRLAELERGQDALRDALRAQGEAMRYNREQEVSEHTAIRREFATGLSTLASEFSGRLWSAAAAVIIAVIGAAVGQGLFG